MCALRWVACLAVVTLAGCQGLDLSSLEFPTPKLRSQTPEQDAEDEFETKVNTPLVGEYTTIAGLNLVTLHGVGLVVGLDGTGGDPRPSPQRTALLTEMKRRDIKNRNSILQSPSTAMVHIIAHLPPLVSKGERFDIEVRLPPDGEATSLNGGWLMETFLSEQAIVPGKGPLKGHELAKASGPILISDGEGDDASLAGLRRRGRILGGGVSRKDRDMSIYLRNDFRGFRNSTRIAGRIGQRFYQYNRAGQRLPLAEAKTDLKIQLQILRKYKNNYPRYLQVIRNIAFRETEVAQRVRMRRLKEELQDPVSSELAALRLEAIGPKSIPFLKTGLENPALEVKFHSAVALAYLGSPDGLPVLAQAAREERAFRVFAYAAMSVVDDAETHLQLRELMNEESAETRYGAFRALTTLDRNDPFVRGEKLGDEFWLHVLETDGEPMIHLTKNRKAEIVLFGTDQRFKTPLTARAGVHILVTAQAGSDEVTVSRYEVGEEDQREVVSTRVADVIRAVAKLGATYPDIAQFLIQAARQENTSGRLEFDALPQAGRIYYRPGNAASPAADSNTKVGSSNLLPNLFSGARNRKTSKYESSAADSTNSPQDERDGDSGDATDLSDGGDGEDETGRRFGFFPFFSGSSASDPE
jgi:hypothetical protein